MFRLIGLLTCVSLAFIFPQYAYVATTTATTLDVASTLIGSIVTVMFLK